MTCTLYCMCIFMYNTVQVCFICLFDSMCCSLSRTWSSVSSQTRRISFRKHTWIQTGGNKKSLNEKKSQKSGHENESHKDKRDNQKALQQKLAVQDVSFKNVSLWCWFDSLVIPEDVTGVCDKLKFCQKVTIRPKLRVI